MRELTVLYDEGCGFCAEIATWLARRPGLAAAPIGSDTGFRLLRDLTPGERYDSVHVVDALGRRRSAGAALPPLLRMAPGGTPLAVLFEAFPWLAERCYRLVSDRRDVAGTILRRARHSAGAST